MSSQANPEVSALAARPRAAGTAAPEPPPVPWASAAPQTDAPAAAPPRPARTTRGRWLTLLAGVIAAGAVLGAVGAAVSAPLRRAPAVVATPLAAPVSRAAAAADASGDPAPAVAPGGAAAGTGSGSARGSGNAAAAPRASGVIASIDGDTITVTTANGPVRVTLAPSANVQKQVPSERSELAAGQRVVVSGEQAADGAVTASGVQIVSGNDPSGATDAAPGGTGRSRR